MSEKASKSATRPKKNIKWSATLFQAEETRLLLYLAVWGLDSRWDAHLNLQKRDRKPNTCHFQASFCFSFGYIKIETRPTTYIQRAGSKQL